MVATRAIRMIQMTVILLSSLKNPVGKRVTATGTEAPTLTFRLTPCSLRPADEGGIGRLCGVLTRQGIEGSAHTRVLAMLEISRNREVQECSSKKLVAGISEHKEAKGQQ